MSEALDLTIRTIARQPSERVHLFRGLSVAEQSVVFMALGPHVQQTLFAALKDEEIVDIIDHLDPGSAERIIARMKDGSRRLRIIKRVKGEAREKIEYFLRFHPKATTALISFNYVLVPETATIGDAADAIDAHYQDTGTFPEVLVHKSGKLVGEVPLSVLVRERNTFLLKKFVQPVATVLYSSEVASVLETLTAAQRKKVIVLDRDESVLGLIYADDVLGLFGKLPAETFYSVSGLDESERPHDEAWQKFQKRYRWLILNLATCFLAGGMVFLFKDTIDRLVILAMYIPIVTGMGQNSGSQTFAVMLRGITLGTVSMKNGWSVIQKEVYAGFLNGTVVGGVVALISFVWNESLLLGLVVGLSMIGVHMVAGFFGAFTPLILKSYGKDPAATAMIFISTATDVLGMLLLLGLGTVLLL